MPTVIAWLCSATSSTAHNPLSTVIAIALASALAIAHGCPTLRLTMDPTQQGLTSMEGRIWWQEGILRLDTSERSRAGRVLFTVLLEREPPNGESRCLLGARRSYSEFRALWRALQRATCPPTDGTSHARSMGRIRRRDSWASAMVRHLGARQAASPTSSADRMPASCRCAQARCPFRRLYYQLKEFPFPRRQVLLPSHKDTITVLQRRQELEAFLQQLQLFFSGYAHSFLARIAASGSCEVVTLVHQFLTRDSRLPRDHGRSHRPSPRRSGCTQIHQEPQAAPLSVAVTIGGAAPALVNDQRQLPRHRAAHAHTWIESTARDSGMSIRHRDVFTRTTSCPEPVFLLHHQSLPQLRIQVADVKTASDSLLELRDDLLRDMTDSGRPPSPPHPPPPSATTCNGEDETSNHTGEVGGTFDFEFDWETNRWERALRAASLQGHGPAVEAILRRGTRVDTVDERGWSALHTACSAGYAGIVKSLLTHGASVNTGDSSGVTPLILAVQGGHLDVVPLLLAAKADAGLGDGLQGMTPLHHAVAAHSIAMVRALLPHGVPMNVKCIGGAYDAMAPWDIAAANGDGPICALLQQYGADVSMPNDSAVDTGSSRKRCDINQESKDTVTVEPLTPPKPSHNPPVHALHTHHHLRETEELGSKPCARSVAYFVAYASSAAVEHDPLAQRGYVLSASDVAIVYDNGQVYAIL